MKKVLFLMISVLVLGLIFAGCSDIANITTPESNEMEGIATLTKQTSGDSLVTKLTAGGGNPKSAMTVGTVEVWDDGTQLCVKYVVDEGYYLTETHLAVAGSLDDIPQTKKNSPIPGLFPYGNDELGVAEDYEECISFDELGIECGDTVYIAAHAVVCEGGVEGLYLDIQDLEEDITIKWPKPTVPWIDQGSYFPGLIVSGGGILDGTYDTAWCGNLGVPQIPYNNEYPATVYSSYFEDGIPYEVIENPENLDAVNWLLNHKDDYIGQTWALCPAPTDPPSWWPENSPWDPTIYPSEVTVDWYDINIAIWHLIDDDISYNPENCYNHYAQVGYDIAQEALAHGKGFFPECGDSFAIILAPHTGAGKDQTILLQTTLIELGFPCKSCETAWGGPYPDNRFNKKDWSIYFTYDTSCPE